MQIQVDEKEHCSSWIPNKRSFAWDRECSSHTKSNCAFHVPLSDCSTDRVHTWVHIHYAGILLDTSASGGERKSSVWVLEDVCSSPDIGTVGAVAPSKETIEINCLRSSGGRFFAISPKDACGVGWTSGLSCLSDFDA